MIDLSPETEALALRIAAARQATVDDVVRKALEATAHATELLGAPPQPRDMSPDGIARRKEAMHRIAMEIAALPVLDPRAPQEIMDDINEV